MPPMSSRHLPRFPVEITNLIVKAVIGDHSSSLASLASTAHSIRNIVNAARFYSIGVYLNFNSSHTKRLAGVLSSDSAVWSENERAVRYIRLLDLMLEPQNSQDTPIGPFIFTIFDAITRVQERQRPRSPTHGLRVRIFSQRMRLVTPAEHISIVVQTPFSYSLSAIDVEVQVALQQLCTNADAEIIDLKDLLHVPDTLVLFSGAPKLEIDRVSFTLNEQERSHFTDLPFKNIRQLVVNNSPSFLQILNELEDASLPTLEILRLSLGSDVQQTDIDPWSRLATKTKTLCIDIEENSDVPQNVLFGNPCGALNHIYLYGSIRLSNGASLSDAYEEVESVHTATFLNAALLLPFTLPPLVDIHIIISVPYRVAHQPRSMAHKALEHVYRSVHHSMLVGCFRNASRTSLLERACVVVEVKFTYFTLGGDRTEFDWKAAELGFEQYLCAKFRVFQDLEMVTLRVHVHTR